MRSSNLKSALACQKVSDLNSRCADSRWYAGSKYSSMLHTCQKQFNSGP
jgi:hypothetical protein